MILCRSCGDKFPGSPCKKCGADPTAEPTIDLKIKLATKDFADGLKKVGKAARRAVEQIEQTPGARHHRRKRQRSLLRSLENTRTSGRSTKHGRRGVR